ncbi:ATP-binding protein [Halogeometricum borinquense]|uniref:Divergent AAA domain-containing protein n=1 Tax=Halogeometricum borinquense (strain ATCC 700274 / DSM 11551 / JCM 10706 / KCTC 4070 / PR3) TaxID=469382 RepID=E4NM60_HALBP|nr:ATP-binding protein [Halogeometricum borinquense]ADQ66159.1 divergent AAA domain-containing protein [Halogeometricum borinquense DSM 11551]ELY27346.1 divergent aaa domain-containing protein [Halogeometricum borinquense DSM 11551]QIQ75549.1 ATP-binding protein [Halogeometricum borinquense]
MSSSDTAHWSETLRVMLNASSTTDSEVTAFIDETIPDGENKLYDNKRQAFIHADSSDQGKERNFRLLKHICALANTRGEQRYRYLFIGFGDSGGFIGASDWDANGGEHVVEVDEARVQDLLSDSLDPVPEVERTVLTQDDNTAAVLSVRRSDSPPVLFDTSITTSGGATTLVKSGVGYVRKGSQSRPMRNSDYRVIIERREDLVNEKIEEALGGLQRMVGISSDQLENLEISATSSDEGVPIDEIVTTEGYSDLNKRLSLSVKEWNSSGELYSSRGAVYTMLKRRDELELDNERCEFLAWSTLNNNFPPTEWIIHHENDLEDSLLSFYQAQLNGRMISVFEAVNYMLENERVLRAISDDGSMDFQSSKADTYLDSITDPPVEKIEDLTARRNLNITGHDYPITDIVTSGGPVETGLEEVVDRLISDDESNDRSILRDIEYTRLAQYVSSDPE